MYFRFCFGAAIMALAYSAFADTDLVAYCVEPKSCGYFSIKQKQFKIAPKYEGAWNFDLFGKAAIKENGKFGFIDDDGVVVMPPRYDEVSQFGPNGLARVKVGQTYGFVDLSGSLKINLSSDIEYVDDFSSAGLAYFIKNNLSGYINSEGRVAIPAKFKSARKFSSDGLARVKDHSGSYFIDTHGNVAIRLADYDYAEDFSNGYAVVNKNGRFGYINKRGDLAIGLSFDDAGKFSQNGLARVKNNGKYGFIDKSGKFAIPAIYDYAGEFHDGKTTFVRKNPGGDVGYIDSLGRFVIPMTLKIKHPKDFSWGAKNLAELEEDSGNFIDGSGSKVIYRDNICGNKVVKNNRGDVIWPKNYNNKVCTKAEDGKSVLEVDGCRFVFGSEFFKTWKAQMDLRKFLEKGDPEQNRLGSICEKSQGVYNVLDSKKNPAEELFLDKGGCSFKVITKESNGQYIVSSDIDRCLKNRSGAFIQTKGSYPNETKKYLAQCSEGGAGWVFFQEPNSYCWGGQGFAGASSSCDIGIGVEKAMRKACGGK